MDKKKITYKHFSLLQCSAVNDLLYLFELKEGTDYSVVEKKDYTYYSITIKNKQVLCLYEIIADLDVYLPSNGIYLSEYIFLHKEPFGRLCELIDTLTVDDLFTHVISQPRLMQARIKYNISAPKQC